MADNRQVDVAVVGAGTAGMRAFREARAITGDVALIEGDRWGTTCARVGCMPSKLLIAAADAAQSVRQAPGFGVGCGAPEIDGRAVMERVRAERDRFVGHVLEAVQGWPAAQKIAAHARFRSDTVLELDDGGTVEADRVVIATGAHTHLPQIFDGLGDRLMTSDDVFAWDDLPGSVAVFGAGGIGLELGQALHRLGVRVALYGKGGHVGPLTDPDVRERAAAIFGRELTFHPDADATPQAADAGVTVTLGGQSEAFDHLLAATGRQPNLGDLGLEHTTLARDGAGVPLHDPGTARCGDSPIFLAGDATSEEPLLHVAAHEGRVAGVNAARFPDIRRFARPPALTILFTDPQIALVGETRAALDAAGAAYAVGAVDWADQGRARVIGANRGLTHLYGDPRTGRFLGAEMVGPGAEHLAHLLAWALASGLTVAEMLDRPLYHPVLEEGLRTALRDLNAAMGEGPPGPARCLDAGPGG
ncbi:MAG: dihydrolipoamide dehydrogenase [Rhodobacteraceae bacterium HLUCCA09]|nr:MAG: dihydrolipoamide dehydrogenase [Rhodobacteraceae bacterium HLUCCA09]